MPCQRRSAPNRLRDSNCERNVMKLIETIALAAVTLTSMTAHAGTPIINLSVGGEISPGVYGQVQFGNAPPPPVFYPEPMIIRRHPAAVDVAPLYLHVPPGHAKKWSRHCHEYDACGRPVYFVKSREYEPGYRSHKGRNHGGEGRRDEGRRYEDRRDEGHRDEGHRDRGPRN